MNPDLAEFVHAIALGAARYALSTGAPRADARALGVEAGRAWFRALRDGILVDMGWATDTTGPAENICPVVVKPGTYANPFPTWTPIPREPSEPPAVHLELAWQIQQLKLGGV